MSYTDARFLSQTLTIERVASRGSDGFQDKTYSAAETFACREETTSKIVKDMDGNDVLATSKVFIHNTIFTVPEGFAKCTLPSGQEVRLLNAEAIKDTKDASIIHHWKAYFTGK